MAQVEKNLPAVWETWVQSLHREDATGPRGPVLCKRSHRARRPRLQSSPRPPQREDACLLQPRPHPAKNNLFITECKPRAAAGLGPGGGCLGEQASEGVARRREQESDAWGHSRAAFGTGTARELTLLARPHPRPHFLFFCPLSWSQHTASS